jgi:hypothetical protein
MPPAGPRAPLAGLRKRGGRSDDLFDTQASRSIAHRDHGNLQGREMRGLRAPRERPLRCATRSARSLAGASLR